MGDRVLIAYASAAGSTAEVAEAIGQELRDLGADVEVRAAKELKDLSAYKAVIVGTGIRMGKLFSDATKFVEKNQNTLRQVPVALFVVCMTMKDDTEESRRTVTAYLDPLREMVEPVEVGLFAGALDYSRLRFPWSQLMKAAKNEVPEGDFRDWAAIRAWARRAHSRLTQE